MYSDGDDAKAPGFPIQKSTDQSPLSAPRSLSQSVTSFIASRCQGIHQMPFSHLRVNPCADTRSSHGTLSTHRNVVRRSQSRPKAKKQMTIRLDLITDLQCQRTKPQAFARGNSLPKIPIYPVFLFGSPFFHQVNGGGGRDRTDDLLLAKQALSQLSYAPSSSVPNDWSLKGSGGPGKT